VLLLCAPAPLARRDYYRCGSQFGNAKPEPDSRCRAKALPVDWLEEVVWADCREFIRNPGPHLEEARRQLREQSDRGRSSEPERQRLADLLAAKVEERQRVITLYRRGRADLDDVDAQLAEIGREEADLRARIQALEAQEVLVHALQDQYENAERLLGGLRDRLDEIERNDDWAVKRQLVELLVAEIRADTIGEGRAKRAELSISYTFSSDRPDDHESDLDVVDRTTNSTTSTRGASLGSTR
jgi:site-specific DNA recombinase